MTDINSFEFCNVIGKFSSKESLIQTGKEGYLQNYEALTQLKNQQVMWEDILKFSGAFSVGSVFVPFPLITLFGAGATAAALEFHLAVSRLASVTEMLLKHFGDKNITITPRVKSADLEI